MTPTRSLWIHWTIIYSIYFHIGYLSTFALESLQVKDLFSHESLLGYIEKVQGCGPFLKSNPISLPDRFLSTISSQLYKTWLGDGAVWEMNIYECMSIQAMPQWTTTVFTGSLYGKGKISQYLRMTNCPLCAWRLPFNRKSHLAELGPVSGSQLHNQLWEREDRKEEHREPTNSSNNLVMTAK